jgi:hypothetical protein
MLTLAAAAKPHRLDGRTIHSYTRQIKRYYLVWAGVHTQRIMTTDSSSRSEA